MKFAAILGAAAVLTAGAASAAEIGVRHTWGTSMRNITHGEFTAISVGAEAYAEQSAGFSLGYEESSTETRKGEINRYVGEPVTLTSERDLTGKFFGTEFLTGESATTTEQVLGDVSEDSDFEATTRDFAGISGSAYTRQLVGGRADYVEETYNFSGSSNQSFSELSTFSK